MIIQLAVSQASSTQSMMLTAVPMKLFVIMFVVILGAFLAWYLVMRNRQP